MTGERLKRVIKRGGPVREFEDERELICIVTRFNGRGEQDETGIVLRMIFQMLKQHDTAIDFCRASSGDCRARRLASPYNFGDASGCIFGNERAKLRVRRKKSQALRERDRVGCDRLD